MKHIKIYVVVIFTFFSFIQNIEGISNIVVEGYELIPYFSEEITNYNIFVNNDTESINITTINDETDDYVSGFGNIIIEDGKNEIILNVIKKTGDIYKYQLNIFRNYEENSDYSNALLKKLEIEGYDIDFNSNIFEYKINVEDISKLDVKYETMSEYSSVKMSGNNNFKPGNNTIKIIVTSKDGNKSIYLLNINKLVSVFEESSTKKEINILGKENLTKKETNIITIVIISIGIIIISLIFFLMFGIKKKR